jgi:hypothetical protein
MSSHTFNEFQRELRKKDIPPNTAFMLTLVYERLAEVMKSQELLAKVCAELATNMKGLADLNEVNTKRMERLSRGLREDGIDIASVANEPEPH